MNAGCHEKSVDDLTPQARTQQIKQFALEAGANAVGTENGFGLPMATRNSMILPVRINVR